MQILRILARAIVACGLIVLQMGCSDTSDTGSQAQPQVLPIVFVHGQSGSAQQFATQAMRFTSNGYPQEQ